jgi:hypothetical protein
MPAAEKHKLVYETQNYVISHAAARWYHCTTVNYRDSSVRGYHDRTVLSCGVSPCLCSYDKTVCGQPVSSVARALEAGLSRDRIPEGARFSASSQTGPGFYPASYTMGTGSFPGVKWPGRGVDHPHHLAPRFMKE